MIQRQRQEERVPASMGNPSVRGLVPRERLDDLKRRHPIEEVAAHFTQLSRVGKHLVGLCPLHEETRPSFTIFPETRSWYCYGCQRGGDVIDLVRLRLDLPFDEALRWLDQRPASVSGPARGAGAQGGMDRARTVEARWSAAGQAALATALSLYMQALWETPSAQRYLARRGLTQDVALRCQVGYASGHQLVDALGRRGIPLQAAWDVGLLVGTARSPQERFAGRIVIPEVRGGAIAWLTGRLVESESAAGIPPDGPKYMSLPGARVLGGAAYLAERSSIVVVEGPFDWLTLVQWNLPGCYIGGGGLPEETRQMLRAARTVYVAFDQDAAGQRMALALAQQLGNRVHLVDLPAGIKDVAELAQWPDGLAHFRSCLSAARGTYPHRMTEPLPRT